MDYTKFLEKTNSFICEQQIHRNIKDSYESIFSFLIENRIVSKAYTVSTKGEGKGKLSTSYLRRVTYSVELKDKEKIEIRDEILSIIKKKKDTIHCEEKSLFFEIGEVDGQYHLALIKLTKELDEKFLSIIKDIFVSVIKKYSVWSQFSALEKLVDEDDVTGLFNQRRLFKELEFAIDRYERTKESFGVLFIDIDHFKSVNDGHGHIVGTKLLKDMGKVLSGMLRGNDYCFRYGGDEFVVLLTDVDGETSLKIGKRILEMIKSHKFHFSGKDIKEDFELSVSIGVACFPQDAKSKDDILGIADKFMYEAKQSGRGQVCYAGQLFKEP